MNTIERIRCMSYGEDNGEKADFLHEVADELETLRARLAELEKQEPVGDVSAGTFVHWANDCVPACGTKLYAAPVVSPGVAALMAELEAARKDAERYRWICSDDRSSHDVAWLTEGDIFYKGKCDIDSAIDAAIEQAKGGV